MALGSGDAWLDMAACILIFRPPGVGKSHVGCGIGHALIDAGYRVLYMRTSELDQRLQASRQSLALLQALAKLDRYDPLILDDISYVRKDQAEASVLFELIDERYERRSILITANQPFSGWSNVFPDPDMTVAAIDGLVHHFTIFELHTVESYRGKQTARDQKLQRDNDKAPRQRQAVGDNDNQTEELPYEPIADDIHPLTNRPSWLSFIRPRWLTLSTPTRKTWPMANQPSPTAERQYARLNWRTFKLNIAFCTTNGDTDDYRFDPDDWPVP